jgi:hypothetical protein
MQKLLSLALITAVSSMVAAAQGTQGKMLSRYKAIEAYEVRPGVLMIPKFTNDGQLCEIGLQPLFYSPEGINLNSFNPFNASNSIFSPDAINRIFDELVPVQERGPRPKNLIEQGTNEIDGGGMVTDEEWENVSIEISSTFLPSGNTDVYATLTWKHRKCK